MRRLGNYILQGRIQAIGIVTVLTLVSMFVLPLAYFLSGSPVGLIALRHGTYAAIEVVLGSMAAIGVLALVAGISPLVALLVVTAIWVPVLVCAGVLRRMQSQGSLVFAAVATGTMFAAAMYLAVGDVTSWWRTVMNVWLQNALPGPMAGVYSASLEPAFPVMNAMMGAALAISIILATLLARWWQALLFNPGGFGREFRELRLPSGLVVPVLLGVPLMLLMGPDAPGMVRDTVIILVFGFFFHGVASVHRVVAARSLSPAWLAGMYGLLLLLPQMLLFIACIGLVDAWMERGRRRTEPANDGKD